MKKEDQFELLVDMMVDARLLAGLSESSEVVNKMQKIKESIVDAVIELGYTETKVNTYSIAKYKEMVNGDTFNS